MKLLSKLNLLPFLLLCRRTSSTLFTEKVIILRAIIPFIVKKLSKSCYLSFQNYHKVRQNDEIKGKYGEITRKASQCEVKG